MSSSGNENIRIASFNDFKAINELINNAGGTSLIKASFGQFNIQSIIENNVLSLVSTSPLDNNKIYSLVSVNDVPLLNGDLEFESTIVELRNYIPGLTVSKIKNCPILKLIGFSIEHKYYLHQFLYSGLSLQTCRRCC